MAVVVVTGFHNFVRRSHVDSVESKVIPAITVPQLQKTDTMYMFEAVFAFLFCLKCQ